MIKIIIALVAAALIATPIHINRAIEKRNQVAADSVSATTTRLLDSLASVNEVVRWQMAVQAAKYDTMVKVLRYNQDSTAQAAKRAAARSQAAVQSLQSSINALSEPATQDPTVVKVVDSSIALMDDNAKLQQAIHDNAEQTSNLLRGQDVLMQTVTAQRDSANREVNVTRTQLIREQARPKQSLKRDAAVAVGSSLLTILISSLSR